MNKGSPEGDGNSSDAQSIMNQANLNKGCPEGDGNGSTPSPYATISIYLNKGSPEGDGNQWYSEDKGCPITFE